MWQRIQFSDLSRHVSYVMENRAIRPLSLSYPKKDWRARPRPSFYVYDIDYKIVTLLPSPIIFCSWGHTKRHIFAWHSSCKDAMSILDISCGKRECVSLFETCNTQLQRKHCMLKSIVLTWLKPVVQEDKCFLAFWKKSILQVSANIHPTKKYSPCFFIWSLRGDRNMDRKT